MLGNEFKKIRIKSGYSQYGFGELLGLTIRGVIECENTPYHIPQQVEEALNKILIKQDSSLQTDKVFSRRLFLKHMLTGNEVIDNLYKEARWLKEIDRKKVFSKATSLLIKRLENNKEGKPIRTGVTNQEYFLPNRGYGNFICKKEWLE